MFIKRCSSVALLCELSRVWQSSGIITGFPALRCLVSPTTTIIRSEASEAVTTERDIKQFGGRKKINIYATENLNKYKSDFRNGKSSKARRKRWDRAENKLCICSAGGRLERLSSACSTARVGKLQTRMREANQNSCIFHK